MPNEFRTDIQLNKYSRIIHPLFQYEKKKKKIISVLYIHATLAPKFDPLFIVNIECVSLSPSLLLRPKHAYGLIRYTVFVYI